VRHLKFPFSQRIHAARQTLFKNVAARRTIKNARNWAVGRVCFRPGVACCQAQQHPQPTHLLAFTLTDTHSSLLQSRRVSHQSYPHHNKFWPQSATIRQIEDEQNGRAARLKTPISGPLCVGGSILSAGIARRIKKEAPGVGITRRDGE
jgi:hypothetical protein